MAEISPLTDYLINRLTDNFIARKPMKIGVYPASIQAMLVYWRIS